MGVNGIYGLSGSGLDIESMVKVGMLGKQAEYDKMQQKYTKDEWKKTEYLNLYGEIQTFNASTISKYKMSANMNSRSADTSNSSAITATANANAATMTHYVEVSQMASSAYLIGTNSPTRLNTAGDVKTQLSSVLFESIAAKSGDDTKVLINGEEKDANEVAFSFAINDGVNGMMISDNSDVVVASASPDAATGTYKVSITSATVTGTLSSELYSDSSAMRHLFSNSVSGSDESNVRSYFDSNSSSTSEIAKFQFTDGAKNTEISFSAADFNDSATNFVQKLNDAFTANGLSLNASYVTEGGSAGISITNTSNDLSTNGMLGVKLTSLSTDISSKMNERKFANMLFLGSGTVADSATSVDYTAQATINVTDEDGNTLKDKFGNDVTITQNLETIVDPDDATKKTYVLSATTSNGITVNAKKPTTGMVVTNTGNQNVSVTYKELLDGFSFYDLTSKVNSMGLNVRMNYDSVQDRFSLYNKKSGEENQINITFGKDGTDEYAAANAVNFFNQLGLKLSSNGEIVSSDITFAQGGTVSQSGVNSIAKVDGVEYKLDSNTVSVDGVTYNFKNVAEGSGRVAVTVSQDIDSIVKNVQSFVDDYNALLNKLYKWYDEKPNSDYKPLTSTQKESMKEEQIEKWEEKAKAGMLYHDKTLGKIITEIRSAVTSKVEDISGKYNNIFSIGISTTGLKGELTLDKDKLKTALSDDPDAVYNVFAKLDSNDEFNSNGVAQRLGDVFQKAMKSVKAVGGSSASIADDSELNNLMRELQTKMSNFKRMMQAFENKLYKKYDAMESSLALLGSQLNYVTSAFQ